jgi:hypothetical protein
MTSRPVRRSSRLAYSIPRLARMTDTSKSVLYQEISSGRLVARKIGRRTIVTRWDAIRWLRSLPQMAASEMIELGSR